MHRLKPVIVLLTAVLMLTSCALLPTHSRGEDMSNGTSFPMDSLDRISDTMFEEILAAIENRDSDTLKAMFSERALEEAKGIDTAIEYLFNLFDGEVISWERHALSCGESSRDGKSSRLIRSWYNVYTENSKYLFLLLNYDQNTIDPDMKGLYTLHGIDDANEDALWSDWVEMKIPGIYMPED